MDSLTVTRTNLSPQWHHIHLSTSQLAAHEHERIKMLFSWFYTAAGKPYDMSLWCAADGQGGADIYLSPKSGRLAGDLICSYRTRPCAPPLDTAILVAGADGAHARKHYSLAPYWLPEMPGQQSMPVRYGCRSVRAMQQAKLSASWLYYSNQMAPFVQRFALAWALSTAPAANKNFVPRSAAESSSRPPR